MKPGVVLAVVPDDDAKEFLVEDTTKVVGTEDTKEVSEIVPDNDENEIAPDVVLSAESGGFTARVCGPGEATELDSETLEGEFPVVIGFTKSVEVTIVSDVVVVIT